MLDRSDPVDADARKLLDQTFVRINALNASAASTASEPLGERADGPPAFVGPRTCAACHTPQYRWWQQTAHGRAYATLVGRHRELDLDCIACHVTGFGQRGGVRIGRLEELENVGCESCHGPGGAHADNPRAAKSMERAVPESLCVTGHDARHSPAFEHASWRARLLVRQHGGERR